MISTGYKQKLASEIGAILLPNYTLNLYFVMTALKVTLQNIDMMDHCRMHQVNELSAQADEQHKVLFSDSIQR